MRRHLLAFACVAFCACGDDGPGSPDGGPGPDGGQVPDASPCPRAPGPADGVRYVVVSHPYDENGAEAGTYEVLELSPAGELSRTGRTFEMGTSTLGVIAFTPDGEVGVVAQKDGSLGVFVLDEGGTPQVVHASFQGSFYADSVVPGPAGDEMLVVDPNWRKNGGGLYRIRLGCDGSIVETSLVAASKSAGSLTPVPGQAAAYILWADEVLMSAAGDDVHYLSLLETPAATGGADAFPDDEAIYSAGAVTFDGRFALGGDNSQFSGIPNRVAVARLADGDLVPEQILTPIEDPIALVASPFDDAAIVASGFGDAVFVLDYDPMVAPPFSLRGEMVYMGASPQLPGKAVMIDRGGLRGLVLLAENVGVRRIRFEAGARVRDLGLFSFGMGLENITGALGVQP